jgi:type IV secretory pathway VirJ component
VRTAAAIAVLVFVAGPGFAADEQLQFGRFGTVTLYRQTPEPHAVALFVSGDGGWKEGVVDMARTASSLDMLVIGIDIRTYLKALHGATEECTYPAADFEALSQFVQKQLHFSRYVTPLLIGYSSGATLVYATLVEAPPGTFRGAVSLGFCPDLNLAKPMCKGHGLEWVPGPKGKGVVFQPATSLEQPWIAFQGVVDQVCDPAGTQQFVAQVPRGEIVMLPKVGHGYSVPKNWEPQFKEAVVKLTAPEAAAAKPEAVSDLPLVEVPATGSSPSLGVVLSGDGGWASLDKEVAGALAARGVPVVGLNSLQYFWKARTPDALAADLARVLRHYLPAWGKSRVVLAGYSFGADVLPFAVSRLPADLRRRVAVVALLGPSPTAEFEFHVGSWLGRSSAAALPVPPEIAKLAGTRTLCFFGDKEDDSPCRGLDPALATAVSMQGGHHFGGAYQSIGERILAELELPAVPLN